MSAHLAYLRYVLRHKWFVYRAGRRLRVPLWQLIVHDWTKFRPSEWTPYVDYFYRPESKNREVLSAFSEFGVCELAPYGYFAEDRFNGAWNLHQKRNPHHWQYWLLTLDSGQQFPVIMPDKYIREMVADWAGAGRAITGQWDVAAWYERNAGVIQMRDSTRRRVEELITMLTAPAPAP